MGAPCHSPLFYFIFFPRPTSGLSAQNKAGGIPGGGDILQEPFPSRTKHMKHTQYLPLLCLHLLSSNERTKSVQNQCFARGWLMVITAFIITC